MPNDELPSRGLVSGKAERGSELGARCGEVIARAE